MKKIHTYVTPLILALVFLPTSLPAQGDNKGNASEAAGPKRFWQANLPSGSYIVALDRISSVSMHSYIIDGTLRVTEVVIDTNGNSLARFYYIIPVSDDADSNAPAGLTSRAKELLDKAGERTGANVNSAVAKQYPTTTHAKTVEFRLSDEADLGKLFKSASQAWIKGNGKKFTIKSE